MMGLAQRRSRWAPTDMQRMILEASYKVSAFPDLEARVHLAHQLRVEVRQRTYLQQLKPSQMLKAADYLQA
ncbi:hypothetical protein Ctob_010889, partial [Chrysochromulina tobinii]